MGPPMEPSTPDSLPQYPPARRIVLHCLRSIGICCAVSLFMTVGGGYFMLPICHFFEKPGREAIGKLVGVVATTAEISLFFWIFGFEFFGWPFWILVAIFPIFAPF